MFRVVLLCVWIVTGWIAATSHAIAEKPLKVFILVGQSNMEGHAHVRVIDYLGDDPQTVPLLKEIRDHDGKDRLIPATWISFLTGERGRLDGDNHEVHGQLTTGYGSQGGRDYSKPGEKIGPELAFGITLQQALDQPILLIKAAWGGQSMHTDFRSPSSGPYIPNANDIQRNRFETDEQKQELKQKTGARYRQLIDHVQFVLKDIKRVCPDYDPNSGFELAGFVWFQGFNDMVNRNVYPKRDQPGGYDDYSQWLTNFILDVRRDLRAPKMPFVIGVMGVGGPLQTMEGNPAVHTNFRAAMAAPAKSPQFKGNVVAVQTAPYWDKQLAAIDKKNNQIRSKKRALQTKNPKHENADGKMTADQIRQFIDTYKKTLLTPDEIALEQRAKSNAGYHYLGSAKTYSQIGQAFAQALLELD